MANQHEPTHSPAAVNLRSPLLIAGIGLILVGAVSLAGGRWLAGFVGAGAEDSGNMADALRTGSMSIARSDGSICEYRQIDNATWRIQRTSKMACEDDYKPSPQDMVQTSPTRIEAIRDGFVQKR
jgi:hypothetical protein